jgi:hypothetical protein
MPISLTRSGYRCGVRGWIDQRTAVFGAIIAREASDRPTSASARQRRAGAEIPRSWTDLAARQQVIGSLSAARRALSASAADPRRPPAFSFPRGVGIAVVAATNAAPQPLGRYAAH